VIKTLEAQGGLFLLGCKCPGRRFLPGRAKDLSAPRYRKQPLLLKSNPIMLVVSFDFLLSIRDVPVLEHTDDTVMADNIFIVSSWTYFAGSVKKVNIFLITPSKCTSI
jgi:hypothetical protein